jgi:IS30 family transposase
MVCQYFPNGSDLSVHTAEDLKRVADILNDRRRNDTASELRTKS